mgnify:CR=1 FL=1
MSRNCNESADSDEIESPGRCLLNLILRVDMKKFIYVLLLFPCLLTANPFDNFSIASLLDQWSAEGRVAYYYPTSKKFRRIFPEGGVDYQVEVSKRVCNEWFVWANTSWFHKKGHSKGIRYRTRVDFIPISLGVKKEFCLKENLSAYLGAGVTYSLLRIRNYSSYVRGHSDKNAFGGILKFGVNYKVSDSMYAGFFTDYIFQEFHFHGHRHNIYRHSVNADGFKIGGNIGVQF